MTQARPSFGLKLIERSKKVEASLWRRFRYEDDMVCHERLFNRYRDMALKIARRQYSKRPPYGLEILDFEQFAFAGLLEAIDRYDPLKYIPFQAYAKHRITGSITDGLAKSSEGGAQYSHRRRLEVERIRSLDVIDEDPLEQISNLAVGLAIGFMLEGTGVFETNNGEDPMPNAYETLSWRELQLKLKAEIDNLTPVQETVIKQHYLNGLAFTQIAQLLNLSKGRVSQIHKSGIDKLRRRLGAFY